MRFTYREKKGSLQSKTLWKWRSALTSATQEVSPDNTPEIASSVPSLETPPVSVNATQEVSVGNTSETAADVESLESATTVSPPSENKITKDSVSVKPAPKLNH
ncbi:MAG: hypothetical protein HQK62_14880 [Desulfamplus sp.]|nr:hypothetical protein [Desulfamplus sp.]